jgi:hypothetical protein
MLYRELSTTNDTEQMHRPTKVHEIRLFRDEKLIKTGLKTDTNCVYNMLNQWGKSFAH